MLGTEAAAFSFSFTTLLIPCQKLVGTTNYASWATAVEHFGLKDKLHYYNFDF